MARVAILEAQVAVLQAASPLAQRFCSPAEAAKFLGVSRGKIYLLFKHGRLKKHMDGHRAMVSVEELRAWEPGGKPTKDEEEPEEEAADPGPPIDLDYLDRPKRAYAPRGSKKKVEQ